ncbi:hypothetical protein HID58_044523 [Brassica napus]|uniref:Uncharacterized protein n=1 Tax=Brassica napus TaxID=3708 RepID=A0ABQ8BL87_BRANA|nr:hypothetical protein HID58_044523 [Brassica napus]
MLVNVGGMEMTMVKREPGKKKNRMVRSSLIRDQYHWSGAAITTKGLGQEPVIAVKAELRRVTNQALSFTGRSQPGNNSVL